MDENLTAFADQQRALGDVKLIALSDKINVASVPGHVALTSIKKLIDEYALAPDRKKGTARALDLASLIALANRGKVAASVLYANDASEPPTLTAVLNYNETQEAGGAPQFGDHRIVYSFPVSDEFTAWKENDGEVMSQADFAAFLEDRIVDIMEPPDPSKFADDGAADLVIDLARKLGGNFGGPAALMQLSRGMAVNVDMKVAGATNLQTGEARINFEETHADGTGAPLVVPSLFLIAIPIFKRGAPYRIAVRLRYRVAAGSVKWFYQIYRLQAAFDDAFGEACAKAESETALPLYLGSPEA